MTPNGSLHRLVKGMQPHTALDSGHPVAQKDLVMIVEAFAKYVLESISKGENVTIPRLGKFTIKKGKPRKLYCFKKKETVMTEPKPKVVFTPSHYIAEALEGEVNFRRKSNPEGPSMLSMLGDFEVEDEDPDEDVGEEVIK